MVNNTISKLSTDDLMRLYNQRLKEYYAIEIEMNAPDALERADELIEQSTTAMAVIETLRLNLVRRDVVMSHDQVVRGFKLEPQQMAIAS